jgi:Sec-independent protein translocase protein TatA
MHFPLAFIGLLHPLHWLLLILVAILLFSHRIPRLAHTIGKTLLDFKDIFRGNLTRFEQDADSDALPSASRTLPNQGKNHNA